MGPRVSDPSYSPLLSTVAPSYLKDMLRLGTKGRYSLRSEKFVTLVVLMIEFKPREDKAFRIGVPGRLWKKLPLKRSQSIQIFKSLFIAFYLMICFHIQFYVDIYIYTCRAVYL